MIMLRGKTGQSTVVTCCNTLIRRKRGQTERRGERPWVTWKPT